MIGTLEDSIRNKKKYIRVSLTSTSKEQPSVTKIQPWWGLGKGQTARLYRKQPFTRPIWWVLQSSVQLGSQRIAKL